jgi:hypothetical protein
MWRIMLMCVVSAVLLLAGNVDSTPVGLVVADGQFRLDAAPAHGSATVFDGSFIETSEATSDLQLHSGVRLRLGPHTAGRVHRDRFLLEKGKVQMLKGSGYRLEALGLWIQPEGGALVDATANSVLHVTAFEAPAHVSKAGGIAVAKVWPGKALVLEPQVAGAAAAAKLSGCLERKDGRFLLTDATAGITVELVGTGLEPRVGDRIEITGNVEPAAKPLPGATQVIRVVEVRVVERGGCPVPPAGRKPAKAGLTAKSKAIIAGVVIGGAAAGAAIAATRGPAAPVSP